MILKTKNFQEAANKILVAVGLDRANANLELAAKDNNLFLRVTNREQYAAVRFELEQPIEFRAVVDATLFLNLISGINTEEFELNINDTNINVKAGKSSYKLAMIYENDKLLELPVIKLEPNEVTVSMSIANDILMSILNVNAREIQKAKKIDVNELQKYYYIDETGQAIMSGYTTFYDSNTKSNWFCPVSLVMRGEKDVVDITEELLNNFEDSEVCTALLSCQAINGAQKRDVKLEDLDERTQKAVKAGIMSEAQAIKNAGGQVYGDRIQEFRFKEILKHSEPTAYTIENCLEKPHVKEEQVDIFNDSNEDSDDDI